MSRVQKKDNLISVRMAYLSLPYDKPNLPNRQLYAHVAIATSAVMTYERLSFSTEKVDHCTNYYFKYYFNNEGTCWSASDLKYNYYYYLFCIGSSTVQLHKYEEADGTKKINK